LTFVAASGLSFLPSSFVGFKFPRSNMVDSEYHPLPTLDVAPTQGGLVAHVKIVKGTGTPQFAPTGFLKLSGYDRGPLLESWQMEGLGL
jgi:hypothetical protein